MDNIDKARQIIKDIVYTDNRVVTKEEQYINLSELANSLVNLKFRARVNQADYWGLLFDINEKIKKAFDIEGITIPFPQIDAHLFDEKKHN